MSREKDIKRLKKSLHETQDILNDLITETRTELEKKWDTSRSDASKRLMEASKRFEKNYDRARAQLDSTIKGTSKDLEKQYATSKKDAEKLVSKTSKDAGKLYSRTSKDAEKLYDKTRHNASRSITDLREEAKSKLEEAKTNLNARTEDLKFRTADFLQGLAGGLIAMRNRLEPKKRLALRNEKEKHHLGKGGYFKRFLAIAIIIVSKKDRLLSLGQQAYHKLQDKGARDAIRDEAREQYDTMRRLMKAYANGEYREFPYMSIVKIVAAVVYFVSVVDLIPDFIPILGLTDDLAVLAWVYASVKDDLQNFVDWEAANERRQEKMQDQNQKATPTPAKSATPAADREASPNTGAATRSTTTPTPVTSSTIGASSSAVNSKAFEGGNKGTETNASTNTGTSGTSAGGATSGGGSENKNTGSTGSATNSAKANTGGTSSGSTSQGGGSNQKSGSDAGGKANK